MALQFRDDTDRLLYIADTGASQGKLMNECCCDTCSDTAACHRYDACCDDTTYDERLTYPHYVVISDAKYTALSDPTCVLHNGCCYCDHDSTTNKKPNVDTSGITDAGHTTCDSCNVVHEDSCITCNTCNSCDPSVPRTAAVTVSNTDMVYDSMNAFIDKMNGGYACITSDPNSQCLRRYNNDTWGITVGPGRVEVEYGVISGTAQWSFETYRPFTSERFLMDSAEPNYLDTCDFDGVYDVKNAGAWISALTAVVT